MVRTYKKKPSSKRYAPVDVELIQKAIQDVTEGMPKRKAAIKYGLSKSTVQRYCSSPSLLVRRKCGQTALPAGMERNLVESIKICAASGISLNSFDIRCVVKDHLEKNGMIIPKFKDNFPGQDWVHNFRKRHKEELSQSLCQRKRKTMTNSNSEVNNQNKDVSVPQEESTCLSMNLEVFT